MKELVGFVSGHLDLTEEEFARHYAPKISEAVARGCRFVVGDARGADLLFQQHARAQGLEVTVFHMFAGPRNNVGSFQAVGGFTSDAERDQAMTAASGFDVAWVRPGRERSGTAKNLARRGR
jgi:hypothetical protein